MTKTELDRIEEEYINLKSRQCSQTGNAFGAHYLLAAVLMAARVDIRGLNNPELEGEAERVLSLGGRL